MHAGLNLNERSVMQLEFQDNITDNEGQSIAEGPQYLVSTYNVGGTGVNLTRAFRVVLLDSDFSFGVEKQVVKRVHRKPQSNPRTFSY